MGGGGVMAALRDDSRFRAGVPTAPYYPNVNFSGVTGRITIDAQRNATKSAVILTVKDGKFAYVETVAP